MLRSLKIENFRCFRTFELEKLGQLNLLVGTNNSGKSSILEAVQLLTSQSNLETLAQVMIGRSEYIVNDERRVGRERRELNIRHLFYGHEIDVGSRLSILGINNDHQEGIIISIENTPQLSLFKDIQELVFVIESVGQESEKRELPLSSLESLPLDYVRRVRRDLKKVEGKTLFVRSSSLTLPTMINLFNQAILNAEEDFIMEALKIIEPNIERIAPNQFNHINFNYRNVSSRSGFQVRLAGSEQLIPIGSMGDGISRILGLALAIVNARNGILLVDEIDTGLHFTTMSDMWKLIWETAKRLNVQVFATTHNSDCWTSLAAIASTENPSEEGITIQRIEKGKSSSVVFTERQLVIAAERGIEVR